MSGDGDRTKVSSAADDTLPAGSVPERSSVPAIPPPPDHRYRLGAELGRGGMGRVVEAFDTHLQRTVALKEMLPSAGNIDRRFQREVRITARLEHASIVPLYDSGRLADGRPITTAFAMTKDGRRLLQMNLTGQLQILDLDSRRSTLSIAFPDGRTPRWVDHDRKIFVDMTGGPPVLLDPVTSHTEALPIDRVRFASVTADGSRVAVFDKDYRIAVIEIATKQVTVIPGHTGRDELLIAPDGTWVAFNERIDAKHERLVVTDLTGHVLAQRDGRVTMLGASAGGKLAVGFRDGLFEITSLAKPELTRLPVADDEVSYLHGALYHGDQLYLLSQQALIVWTGKTIVRLRDFADTPILLVEMKNDVLAVTTNDGRIYLYRDGVMHGLVLTARGKGIVRIAAVPGSARLVATAKDALIAWDIDQVFPRRLPPLNNPVFATDSMIVSPGGLQLEWKWLDATSGALSNVPLVVYPGMPRGVDITSDDGRTLVVIDRQNKQNTAVIGASNGTQFAIEGVQYSLARLIEGGGVVYSSGKGRVFGKLGSEDARELVTLDGDVRALAPYGKLGYTALSARGELVRGGFDGSNFSRTRVTDVGAPRRRAEPLLASGTKS